MTSLSLPCRWFVFISHFIAFFVHHRSPCLQLSPLFSVSPDQCLQDPIGSERVTGSTISIPVSGSVKLLEDLTLINVKELSVTAPGSQM